MQPSSFRAVVRIRLYNKLEINLDVTECYTDAIKAAVGERTGKSLAEKLPTGTIVWHALDVDDAKRFLNKLNTLALPRSRFTHMHSMLRKLTESTAELNVLEDIHRINPVELTILNGGRTNCRLSRQGYKRMHYSYSRQKESVW